MRDQAVGLLQQWYTLADEALEDALYGSQTMRELIGIDQASAIKRETASRLNTTSSVRCTDTSCILAISSPRLSL